MLQAMRNKMHGWPSIIVLGVAVFAMTFFGVEGYIMSRADTYVAKVGKQEISQQDFQDRMNQLRQQLSEEQGDNFDADAFEILTTRPSWKASVRLLEAGVTPEELAGLRGPIGLDLGGRAPAETALAILAEIVAARYAGSGRPMRDLAHEREAGEARQPIAAG